MSLILEALNKAERNQGPTTGYSAPPTYLLEKKPQTKWTFILLIIIACLTSVIITLLIFNNFNSNNKPPQVTAQNTVHSTSATQPDLQQIKQKQNFEPPYNKPIVDSTIENTTTLTSHNIRPPQNEVLPEDHNLTNHREPSLHHLLQGTEQNKKLKIAPHEHKSFTTSSDSKEGNSTNTTTKSIEADLPGNTDKTDSAAKINDIKTASNLELKDIKISVHMYSKIPAKRFVYINSTRYSEGSEISTDLSIDEITENGVILNSHGTLYRLPLKP